MEHKSGINAYKQVFTYSIIAVIITLLVFRFDPSVAISSEVGITNQQVYGAIIDVAPVLWREPGQWREYDRLILQKPGEYGIWANNMDTAKRRELVGKADSQLLFGESVIILEERGDWLRVAALEQRTSLSETGYPGWLPKSQVSTNELFQKELRVLPLVAVAKPFVTIYKNPDLSIVGMEVSYQTRLPLVSAFRWLSHTGEREVAAVRLPDGDIGFLYRTDIQLVNELSADQEAVLQEANQFLGLAYIWAGTSAYGFDCSGFAMRVYQSQGISISRDAKDQALEGTEINKPDLQPGDLLFFANNAGKGQIYHVGIYAGDGTMIHAPNSASVIQIDSIYSSTYQYDYYGARRYIK